MFRRMMALLVAIISVLSLAACSGETQTVQDPAQTTAADTKQTTAPTETKAPAVTEGTDPTGAETSETTPTEPKAKVDEAKLKNIQDWDTFPVKVKELSLQENYYQEFSWDGNDAMVTTVVNNLDQKITGFTLVALVVDKDGKDVGMDTLGGSMLTKSEADKLLCSGKVMMLSSDMEMAPGQEETFANRCDMEKFENAYMIVYSYTDASGDEIVNENALDWLANTKPVEA